MSDPRCGTVAGYVAHRARADAYCRPCRTAKADWQRQYRARLYLEGPLTVDATGSQRRLQALLWLGWPQDALAVELGVTGPALRGWLAGHRVLRSTAERVAALYDELWRLPGPSARTRLYARRVGFVSPLAWDDDTIDDPAARPHTSGTWSAALDEVAVERAMHGYPTHLRPAERAEASRRLTAAGMSAAQIADRLHVTPRSVQRLRGRGDEVA